MDKSELLEKVFSDDHFQKEIQQIRLEIEDDLSKFIKKLNEQKKVGLKIFENLESRIKSKDSFCEKIRRKDYINTWEIPDKENEIQDFIAINLPDLIGFRVNCFFYKDEEVIFNELKSYYEENLFSAKYKINFNENRRQKNGHDIYKVSGCYDKYNFEIQIKCSVHNIWGEVEHSRIYKREHYDPKIDSKKQITEEVFSILKSSDKQLMTIFEEKYSEKDLIQSLFYQYTYEQMISNENTVVLSKHYQHFFDIFKETEHLVQIKKYIAEVLTNSNHRKGKLDFNQPSCMKSEEFLDKYIEFDIRVVFDISSLIYEWSNMDEFIHYLIKRVEDFANDDYGEGYDIDYSEPDDQSESENLREDIINMYTDYFTLKKGGSL